MQATDPSAPLQLLGGISAEQFLAQYWQHKPLLIRQAIPDFAPPLDADELAGLACEADIESRIITGNAEGNNWQLQHGPFSEATFSALGERDWTLLVQAVDHYIDEVAQLRSRFRFIPDWRIDDVMVSFAAPGGSVGPHLDQYDVFLLQAQGRREWQVGELVSGAPDLLPHPELQLLRNFTCNERFVLEPGDMLYLPPGFPHWGIALDACMTYSVGFRAPSHEEIISHYCDDVLANVGNTRFGDAGRKPTGNPGLIDKASLEQVRNIVARLLDEQQLANWFGRHMTAPKYAPDDAPGDEDDMSLDLSETDQWIVQPTSRVAYAELPGGLVLYADGESYNGSGELWPGFVQHLCAEQWLELAEHPQWLEDAGIYAVVEQLVQRGVLDEDL